MKKKISLSIVFLLIMILLSSSTFTVFAASLNFPYSSFNPLNLDENLKTIASSTGGGMDCRILICTIVENNDSTDVFMYDKNNNLIWESYGAVPSNVPTNWCCISFLMQHR